ncbi:MAG TPA: hypothetical protein VF938_03340 [Candidatus Angelobacter sp.]
MYFSPRIRTLMTLCAAIALVAMSLPVSAQNARPRTSVPEADLRIKVIVVPAIAPHRKDKDKDHDEGAVTYDLQPQREEFSVTEEVRPMLVNGGNNAAQHEQVRIITVVPK